MELSERDVSVDYPRLPTTQENEQARMTTLLYILSLCATITEHHKLGNLVTMYEPDILNHSLAS